VDAEKNAENQDIAMKTSGQERNHSKMGFWPILRLPIEGFLNFQKFIFLP
jgi:hypothetical protein